MNNLVLGCYQQQALQNIAFSIDGTNSCFKKLSRLLKRNTASKALNCFSTVCKYKSLSDVLLCKIVPFSYTFIE